MEATGGHGPVVLVEGESDAVVVRALLARRGAAADVVPMGGVTNLAAHLDPLGGPAPHVLALVDAPEVRFAVGALRRHGVRAETLEELGWHGVLVCDRDLEDVLIRALGPDAVLDALAGMAELGAFESLAQMPHWRGRPVAEQLHRFAGSGSGRKSRLAARLADRLDPAALPDPLGPLVDAVLAMP
ncbi:ATP-dependent endonuclease [Phycicoccus sonneratiae]|uniref:ATP-dependent endonuclease n=1 Tax=Phycicoccus sonneratiae TaxID=2807628 RepID=A0ABS2CQ95_9MICO|nr:ATP-dependent endonuclease [Phycicoccus sonneraticus]MBM6401306.1 ATP-dependent endonuclease [Phycicoccus sonneraticus]